MLPHEPSPPEPRPLPRVRHRVRKAPPAPSAESVGETPPAETLHSEALPAAGKHAVQGDYDVGYGKPPKHTRFQPVQSGNSKGRPKGSRNLSTLTRSILDERVTVTMAGGGRKLSRIEAMIRKLIENANKGDPRAIAQVLKMYEAAHASDAPAGSQPEPTSETLDLTATDEASIELLKAMLMGGTGMDTQEGSS